MKSVEYQYILSKTRPHVYKNSSIADEKSPLKPVQQKRVSVVVLDMPLLDTREDRDLTGILVADIVLQLLSLA